MMNRTKIVSRPSLWVAALLCLVGLTGWALAAANDVEILTSAPGNTVWQTGSDGRSSVFTPTAEQKEPIAVFKKSFFKEESFRFEIQSDAKAYTITSGTHQVTLNIEPRREISLQFDGDEKKPQIKLNGAVKTLYQEKFEQLLNDPDSNLTFWFNEATRVEVKARSKSNRNGLLKMAPPPPTLVIPGKAPATPDATAPAAPSDADKVIDLDEMYRRAETGMFRLRVYTDYKGVHVHSTGFFLNRDGFALTSFHAIRGAVRATAIFPRKTEEYEVELWDVRPELDLALIKIDPASLPRGTTINPIPVAPIEAQKDQSIWVMSVSETGRLSHVEGLVMDVTAYSQLPKDISRALVYPRETFWVHTDAQAEIYNSGSPLVNNKGQLMATLTWIWRQPQQQGRSPFGFGGPGGFPGGFPQRPGVNTPGKTTKETNYALDSAHVLEILNKRPEKPVTFKVAVGQYGFARGPQNYLPMLEVVKDVKGLDLQNAAINFKSAAICPVCEGQGFMVEKVQNGTKTETINNNRNTGRSTGGRTTGGSSRNSGPTTITKKNYEDTEVDCPKCKGTGFTNADLVFKLVTNVTNAVARIDRTDPRAQPAIEALRDSFKEVVKYNPGRLVDGLNDKLMDKLADRTLKIGTPLIGLGSMETNQQIPMGTVRAQAIRVGGDTAPVILISDLEMTEPKLSDDVMFGGLFAGYVDNDKGEPMLMIRRGFISNIPQGLVDERPEKEGKLGSREDIEKKNNDKNGGRTASSGGSGGASSAEQRRRDEMRRQFWQNRGRNFGGSGSGSSGGGRGR